MGKYDQGAAWGENPLDHLANWIADHKAAKEATPEGQNYLITHADLQALMAKTGLGKQDILGQLRVAGFEDHEIPAE